jgi:hypothetical protein
MFYTIRIMLTKDYNDLNAYYALEGFLMYFRNK